MSTPLIVRFFTQVNAFEARAMEIGTKEVRHTYDALTACADDDRAGAHQPGRMKRLAGPGLQFD